MRSARSPLVAFVAKSRRASGRRAAAALIGAATIGLGAARAADTAVRVTVERAAGLPFSTEALLAAVDARLPLAQDAGQTRAIDVRVSPAETPGRVLVSAPAATVDVLTDGKAPAEAARLVALAIVDVTRAAAPAPTAAPPAAVLSVAAPPAASARGSRLAAALYPGVSAGLGGSAINFEPTADLSLAVGGAGSPWRLGLSAGFARASAPWMDRSFTLATLPLRLGTRCQWRRLELGGGAVARLYDTGGLDGGRGAMLGGFASVGTSGPLGGRWRWTVVAAGDAYSDKTVFRAGGMPVLTAGPFIFWLGVGARFGGGPS